MLNLDKAWGLGLAPDVKIRPQGYKTVFVLVIRLELRTRSLCSTEYETKNRDYKSLGVRFPLRFGVRTPTL